MYDQNFRPLTDTNLNRITKGCEKNGCALLEIQGSADHGKTDAAVKELKRCLTKKKCSYIIIYGGDPGQEEKASMDRFFVVFPYSITKRTVMDLRSFEEVIDGLSAVQAPGVSVLARIDPISQRCCTEKEPFFSQIRRLCFDAAGNSSPNYALYIDNPPTSMQIGHARWAAGNMNHIYKELERK